MPHPFVLCDVFAAAPLQGNQLGVFTAAERLPEAALQPLARELNFSETTFVYPPSGDDAHARVRIFTPTQEFPFAGHPLLGTAAVVGEALGLRRVCLETGVGPLEATLEPHGDAVRVRLAAPLPRPSAYPDPAGLRAALGLPADGGPVAVEDAGMPHAYVELPDAAAISALRPDLQALVPHTHAYGANCFALDGTRVRTRMFAPGDGVPEDPATGSAAVGLAALLVRTGRVASGAALTVEQGAEIGRPSVLHVRAEAVDGEPVAIELAGDVVVVAQGAFYDRATTATVASVGSPQ